MIMWLPLEVLATTLSTNSECLRRPAHVATPSTNLSGLPADLLLGEDDSPPRDSLVVKEVWRKLGSMGTSLARAFVVT